MPARANGSSYRKRRKEKSRRFSAAQFNQVGVWGFWLNQNSKPKASLAVPFEGTITRPLIAPRRRGDGPPWSLSTQS